MFPPTDSAKSGDDVFPPTDNVKDINPPRSFHVECMAGSTMYSLPTRTFYQTAQETIIENAWIS
jgi:hypothetical protein